MKAILVIDINDELLEDYENFYVDYDLRAERKNDNVTESIRYVENCPLKPMPQKKEVKNILQYSGLVEQYRKEGWNDCIDEILGGNEQ